MSVRGKSSKAAHLLRRLGESTMGMTLIETLVAMVSLVFVLGLTCTCLYSSMCLLHDGHQQMKAEELGKLFIAGLENDLRGATSVEVTQSGRAIAFRCASGEAIAYVFDDEHLTLARHVRGSDEASSPRADKVFPDDFRVASCTFRKERGFASAHLTLTGAERERSNRAGAKTAFQARVALRICE